VATRDVTVRPVRLTAQEEYGLRCLLQVARRAPAGRDGVVAIREVAEAEGLSLEYAAKLLRVLRQAELLESERGAAGGYRLAREAGDIALSAVMAALDQPMFGAAFCGEHAGQGERCVHQGACALRPVWNAIDDAVSAVLARLTLADLVRESERVAPSRAAGAVP
jgi:Rrf2 family protein